MLVGEAIARTLVAGGVDTVFGLIGSGNLVLANALRDAGARFVAARHESNATSMADGFARASGRVAVVTVHQGPGFTNTVTHLTEAAKSRTPLLLLAADTPAATLWSNFLIDQAAIARETGALVERIRSVASAGEDAARALRRTQVERRPVVLLVPTDVVSLAGAELGGDRRPPLRRPAPAPAAVRELADLVQAAERPAIVAGRGAVLARARRSLELLADRIGAALATTGVAHGLFAGHPQAIGICGGFSSPLGAEVLGRADLILAFGASLNHWTTHNGHRFSEGARIAQVDLDAEALGALCRADVGVVGDADETARALVGELVARGVACDGFRAEDLATAAARRRWRDEPYEDEGTADTIDPRTLTIALDDLLPEQRTVATDGGHFLGYPSMYLSVPDEQGFVFPQAFQGIGQGLGAAIGAATARPDRLTVAALGDGGTLMALSDLETAARERLRLLIVVYDDAAYGAEVHHFGPLGHATDLVRFPDTDFAALARAAGANGITVRAVADLAPVAAWLERHEGPLLIDAKVNPSVRADWVDEAFAHD